MPIRKPKRLDCQISRDHWAGQLDRRRAFAPSGVIEPDRSGIGIRWVLAAGYRSPVLVGRAALSACFNIGLRRVWTSRDHPFSAGRGRSYRDPDAWWLRTRDHCCLSRRLSVSFGSRYADATRITVGLAASQNLGIARLQHGIASRGDRRDRLLCCGWLLPSPRSPSSGSSPAFRPPASVVVITPLSVLFCRLHGVLLPRQESILNRSLRSSQRDCRAGRLTRLR